MTGHTLTVAKKDFADAGRSKLLWSIIGLLVGLSALGYVIVWYAGEDVAAAQMLGFLAVPLGVLVPVAALIGGYMAIVGERRSGSLKLLLGLPPNRTDVVFGKLLGRAGVIALAVVLSYLVATVLSLLLFGSVPIVDLAAMAGLSILYGVAFVGLAVGVSAGVSSRGRAMALTVGTFMVFFAFWELLTAGIYYFAHDGFPPAQPETWYLFVQQLNPLQSFAYAASTLVEGQVFPVMFRFNLDQTFAAPADRVAGDVPFYLQEWFGALLLLVWVVVPVAIGYYRFGKADL
ncbi:ABC transporter permease [Halovivax cerinus]|uniref:ABC transporter permease n=1 Tax=Halovivax cerinus TaxID=1487865 RepID=A0ABD5NK31_9EURY|nr:ABC transporter permease subunit [Halovivax cerinus]